ncbi:MAG: hypothetical protein Q4A00_06310 [Flavobacteriaceae bacterium]|nr:hypothetical protein [Flavobacteriaceae bacterium]
MKKVFLLFANMFVFSGLFSQEKEAQLTPHFKIEAFVEKIGLGYEVPLSSKVLLDVNAGVGGANIVIAPVLSYKLGRDNGINYYGIFVKGQLRYYISRDRRAKKGRSLGNNVGTFVGLQSKLNFNNDSEYWGNVWLSDVHFGQQLPLGEKFVFRYHLGVGYTQNLTYKDKMLYPAVNLVFGYLF